MEANPFERGRHDAELSEAQAVILKKEALEHSNQKLLIVRAAVEKYLELQGFEVSEISYGFDIYPVGFPRSQLLHIDYSHPNYEICYGRSLGGFSGNRDNINAALRKISMKGVKEWEYLTQQIVYFDSIEPICEAIGSLIELLKPIVRDFHFEEDRIAQVEQKEKTQLTRNLFMLLLPFLLLALYVLSWF